MKKYSNMGITLLLSVMLFLSGCNAKNNGSNPQSLVSIQISPAMTTLAKGFTSELTATGVHADGSTEDITYEVNWHSDDTSIVSVAENGFATGESEGESMITASIGHIQSNDAKVAVTSAELSSIQITRSSFIVGDGYKIAAGFSIGLTATGAFSDGSTADISHDVSWSSDDMDVAVVTMPEANHSATLKGLTPGVANITALKGDINTTVPIVISDAELVDIQISGANMILPPELSLPVGFHAALIAIGHFSDHSTADITRDVNWNSDNKQAATVISPRGLRAAIVNAHAEGEAVITAGKSDVSGSIDISVTQAELLDIYVTSTNETSEARYSMVTGYGVGLIAMGSFSDNTVVDITNNVSWSSDDASVAVVNNSLINDVANVEGVSKGRATITASKEALSSAANVIVTDAIVTHIDITSDNNTTEANYSTAKGYGFGLKAIAYFSDQTSMDITHLASWISDDLEVATVYAPKAGGQAKVIGVSEGRVYIRVFKDNVEARTNVNVASAVLESIQITKKERDTVDMTVGNSVALLAMGKFSDDSEVNLSNQVKWTSNRRIVASVNVPYNSSVARVVGRGEGTATITAVKGELESEVDVNVAAVETEFGLCGDIDDKYTSPNGACLKIVKLPLKGYVASNPSLAALNKLGYTLQVGPDIVGDKTYSGIAMEGIDDEVIGFGTFNQLGGDEAGEGGEYDRWCQNLNDINFAGLSNWRRADIEDLQLTPFFNGIYGWPGSQRIWTSTPSGDNFKSIFIDEGEQGNVQSTERYKPLYGYCFSPLY